MKLAITDPRLSANLMRGGMIHNARGKREKGWNEEGPQKIVTMAPISRYLNKQQYVMRTPMFSVKQHPSILKKTFPKGHAEKEEHLRDYVFSTSRADWSLESLRRPPGEPPLAAVSSSHMGGFPEIGGSWLDEEPPAGAPSPRSRAGQQRWPCSVLEAQTPNPPVRPQLTSTVLNPTYTPLSRYSGRSRKDEGARRTQSKQNFSGEAKSKKRSASSYQTDYWACAIPKMPPPSGEGRRTPGWDPDRDYETLLNYTYPVRPGHGDCEWEGSQLEGPTLLQTQLNLQDSGIEVDKAGCSSSLSGFDSCLISKRLSVGGNAVSASEELLSDSSLSQTLPAGLSLDSLVDGRGADHGGAGGQQHHRYALSPLASTALICSTTFPPSKCVGWDLDHEFMTLPDHLEELQLVARQVRKLTVQLSRPVATTWTAKQEAEEEFNKQEEEGNQDSNEGHDHAGNIYEAGGSSEAVMSPETWMASHGLRGLSQPRIGELAALGEELCGLTLHHSQRSSEEAQEHASLMENIQIFCSHLERLIQWLYTLPEKMDLLTPPSMDIDSVKVSLAGYQSFQREVSSHQPLTSCVLHTGQQLLRCMTSTSPAIKDTLLLIERQSRALESHAEHFFSSILSAMDSITQPSPTSPLKQSGVEEASPVGL